MRKFTDEHRRKLSLARMGKKPWHAGLHLSKEHKRKISEAQKDQHHSPSTEFKKDCIPWNKGKKGIYSKEALERMSESHKGKKHSKEHLTKMSESHKGIHSGAKHPNWQGGIGREPYGFDFNKTLKEKIRKRDGYCCQNCGKPQKENRRKLAVHHINYNKKDCRPEKLISLCDSCNIKANKNRNNWQNYYEEMLSC